MFLSETVRTEWVCFVSFLENYYTTKDVKTDFWSKIFYYALNKRPSQLLLLLDMNFDNYVQSNLYAAFFWKNEIHIFLFSVNPSGLVLYYLLDSGLSSQLWNNFDIDKAEENTTKNKKVVATNTICTWEYPMSTKHSS